MNPPPTYRPAQDARGGERRRLLLARYRAHRAAVAAARQEAAPHPPSRALVREHLTRALQRP